MDGDNRTVLATITSSSNPTGLALDQSADRLYWIDLTPWSRRIRYLDMVTLVVNTLKTVNSRPLAVAVYGNALFMTDLSGALYILDRTTGGYSRIKSFSNPRGIVAHSMNESFITCK